MNKANSLGLLLAAVLGPAPAIPAPAEAPGPYQPLAFLVGHCWKGTFPDSQVTDEHCFSWIYGGKFVRDEHVVHRGGGQPDAHGESIYLWDGGTHELQYLYIESAGGFSRGTVTSQGATLVFPPARFTENGTTQTYRSRWALSGADGYDVLTEFQNEDRWVEGFKLHMQRVPDRTP